MSNYTFKLTTTDEFIRKAQRELYRMRYAKSDDDRADHAFNLAITLWHIADWVWKSDAPHVNSLKNKSAARKKKKVFDPWLFQECGEIEICAEIADGSKHFSLDRKAEADKVVRAACLSVPVSFSGHQKDVVAAVLKIELSNGEKVSAEKVFKNALNFWKDYIKSYQIK